MVGSRVIALEYNATSFYQQWNLEAVDGFPFSAASIKLKSTMSVSDTEPVAAASVVDDDIPVIKQRRKRNRDTARKREDGDDDPHDDDRDDGAGIVKKSHDKTRGIVQGTVRKSMFVLLL
jgi:hypothetical protein